MKGAVFDKWPSTPIDTRNKLGLSHSLHPWTIARGNKRGRVRFRGLGASARMIECANICFWSLRLKSKSTESLGDIARGAYANLSQCVSRLAVARRTVPCFGQNALVYSYEHDAVLSGACQLQSIGWPGTYMPSQEFTDHELRTLSGDFFSVPICCAVQTCLIFNPFAEWWPAAA